MRIANVNRAHCACKPFTVRMQIIALSALRIVKLALGPFLAKQPPPHFTENQTKVSTLKRRVKDLEAQKPHTGMDLKAKDSKEENADNRERLGACIYG